MIFKRNPITGERPFLRQYYLFHQALCEAKGDVDENLISVDHSTGSCYYGDTTYGVIYPKSWIPLFYSGNKEMDFFFQGYFNDNRKWVSKYINERSIIEYSNRGREIPRGFFDDVFFTNMGKSKFTPCPQGHPYKWTYRFYEAVLSKSIPILTEDDIIDDYLKYKFYLHNDDLKYEYSMEMVEHNYNIAMETLFIK